MIYALYRIIPNIIVTIVILIVLELLAPDFICHNMKRVHDISFQKKTIIVNGDTLIYNKTTKEYEQIRN